MINITTFRNYHKKFFDEADTRVVEIERDGKIYYLSSKPVINESRIEKLLLKILEKIEKPEESKTKVYFDKPPLPTYIENIVEKKPEPVNEGLSCCKKQKKPCKHWQYNYQDSVWVNVLTNETREVNE